MDRKALQEGKLAAPPLISMKARVPLAQWSADFLASLSHTKQTVVKAWAVCTRVFFCLQVAACKNVQDVLRSSWASILLEQSCRLAS